MPLKKRKTNYVSSLRQEAEDLLEALPSDNGDSVKFSPDNMKTLIHDLQVHQIELEMQNDELRRTQMELAVSKERYFDLYDLAPVGYITVSEKGILLETNITATTLLGKTRNELVKQPVSQFIFLTDQDIYYLHRKLLFETGDPQKFELRMVQTDKLPLWVQLDMTAAQDEGGAPVCRIAISDITERKQAEEALRKHREHLEELVEKRTIDLCNEITERKKIEKEREQAEETLKKSEELLRSTQELTKVGGWEWDLESQTTFWTDEIYRIHDIQPGEIPAGSLKHIEQSLECYGPADRPVIQKAFINCIEKGQAYDLEFPFTTVKGRQIWIRTIAKPIRKKGVVVKVIGNLMDISDRKQAEKEKKQLEKRLLRMEKMEALGLLAGGVAHDLNNVLSGIVSYPELLMIDLPNDHRFQKPLDLIYRSGLQASAIVNDLLTLARRGVMATEVVNLNIIIMDYLKSPEHHQLLSYYNNVVIKTNLSQRLANTKGSEIHLRTTIMNLVSNAAEAQPSGGQIIISTENLHIDKPIQGYESIKAGEFAVVTIEDKGIGINGKDLQRIFEPFYTKKIMGRSGTGLGMAVVWGTVQDHCGYINIESSENKGTKFYLYFPIVRQQIEKKHEPLFIEQYFGNGEIILIVDDVEGQRQIGKTILKRLNYKVETVSSGEESLEYLKNNSCDLVLLDMIMDPGIDGLETYKQIISLKPDQKVIIASGFSESERVKEAQKLGAGHYIKKPYSVEKVGLVIKEELGK